MILCGTVYHSKSVKRNKMSRSISPVPPAPESPPQRQSRGMSLSLFAQSAFKSGETLHDSAVKRPSVSRKRRSDNRVKRKKYQSTDWDKMLAEQWGGGAGGGGGGDSSDSGSDIQSYSNEGQGPFCAESAPASSPQSAAIMVASSDEDFTAGRSGIRIVRHVHRHRPAHKKGTAACEETIEDYSPSSDSDEGEPLSAVHLALTKPSKKLGRALHLGLDSTGGPPDHMTISTPPSSPEQRGFVTPPHSLEQDGDATSKVKTSDWIRQVHLDRSNVLSMSCDFPDMSELVKTPGSSSKRSSSSSSSSSFSRRLLAGGLAERLQKLVQRERSEVTFWEHKTRTMKKDIDTDFLTVHVLSLSTCCAVVMAKCKVLHGNVYTPPCSNTKGHGFDHTRTRDKGTGEVDLAESAAGNVGTVTVFFSQRSARFVELAVGRHVQIHPPWQTLALPSRVVILCPHFSIGVGFSPVPPSHTTPPTQGLASSSKTPGFLPMHLFAGSRLLGAAPTETRNADAEVAQYATESPPTDLMALAGARVGVAPPFVATIMRAFRRACPLQCPDRQTMLAMKSWETNWRWSVLVRDTAGCYAEIRMPSCDSKDIPISTWRALVESGEGTQCCFSKLRVISELDPSRELAVFSVISSLELEGTAAHLKHVCYRMEWLESTQFKLCTTPSNAVRKAAVTWREKAAVTLEERRRNRGTRIDLLAKIVSFRPEIPVPSCGHGPPIRCGHYLGVVSTTTSHLHTPPSSADHRIKEKEEKEEEEEKEKEEEEKEKEEEEKEKEEEEKEKEEEEEEEKEEEEKEKEEEEKEKKEEEEEKDGGGSHIPCSSADHGSKEEEEGGGSNLPSHLHAPAEDNGVESNRDSAQHEASRRIQDANTDSSCAEDEQPQFIMIYLKLGFVVEGLQKVLSSRGEVVLLRDVELCQTHNSSCYFMDVCSLLVQSQHLQDTSTRPEELQDTTTRPERLHILQDITTRPEQLQDTSTRPGKLQDITTRPEQLEDTSTCPEQLQNTTCPEQLQNTTCPEQLQNTTCPEQLQNTTCLDDLQGATTCPESLQDVPTQLQDTTVCPEKLQDATTCPKLLQDATTCPDDLQGTTTCPERLQDVPTRPEQLQDTTLRPEQLQDRIVPNIACPVDLLLKAVNWEIP